VALKFAIELEFRNVVEGGKKGKTLGARTRTNNKLNPLEDGTHIILRHGQQFDIEICKETS